MPDFTISTTGGLFTATTSWTGGVVPPSASQSHIIGLSSSGPLYFNNLGARTIGSLVLTDFTNILGFTGSSNTITLNGPTMSFGSGMNYTGATGSTALPVNQRFIIQPIDSGTFSIFNNGIKIKRSYVSFRWSGVATATGRINIVDDMWFEDEFYLLCHSENAGPSVNRAVVGSATSSVRAKIYFDHKNSISQWNGTRQMTSKGYEVDFILSGTGSGRLRWTGTNYYGNRSSLPERSTFEIQSGDFRIDNNLAITKETLFKYTGGTVSGSKRIYLYHHSTTNNTEQTNVYFNTPGLQFGIVDMRHDLETTTATLSLYNLNGFSTDNLLISNAAGSVANPGPTLAPKIFNIYGTNSTTYLGNVVVGGTYLSGGGVFSNGFWYGWTTLNFDGGKTYSLKRFKGLGAWFDDSPNIVQPGYTPTSTDPRQKGYFYILGTNSTANLSISQNENMALWCNFNNINVTGTNKIYAFGSTWSNSTGIEGTLPTGSGGSTEYSYSYIG